MIASAALQAAAAHATARYATPPLSDQAFDCSYFVWLTLKKINPLFRRESSKMIAEDRLLFQPVIGQPQAGDIIYFPPSAVGLEVKRGDKRIYPGHVAVMLSPTRFLGMQSHGLGQVETSNPWWGSRPFRFFRYIGPAS